MVMFVVVTSVAVALAAAVVRIVRIMRVGKAVAPKISSSSTTRSKKISPWSNLK